MEYTINGQTVDMQVGDMVKPYCGTFPIDPNSKCSAYLAKELLASCPIVSIFDHYEADGEPVYIKTALDCALIESVWRKI